ncbi:MAG: cytochrome P450 [Dehalococcoidia bacterium]
MNVREAFQDVLQNTVLRAIVSVERVQTGVAWNPLDKRYRSDPYPLFANLRTKDPFHRSRLINGWVLTRYDDVSAVLRDGRFLADDRKLPGFDRSQRQLLKSGVITEEEAERRKRTAMMLRTDPPDHTRLRSLVSKAFTPKAVEALRPRIEAIVTELLDAVAERGEMDVIRDLAYPLPVIVIAEMLGLPVEDREQFKRWSDDLVLGLGIQTLDEVRRSFAAQRELAAYIRGLAEERRGEPREDLLSALVAAEEEGDKLTDEEVFTTVSLLLVAGNETTTNLIGNGLLALLRHPHQVDLLRDSPDRLENAIEELLRFDSPVQATTRFVLEDTQLDGHTVRANQQVALLLGAANHDPERFPDPDRLDVTRENVQPLSFGHGIHYCLGAPLARVEGRIAFGALLERFPHLRLATDHAEWSNNLILRGLTSLPVMF